jgi:hypothetical protein
MGQVSIFANEVSLVEQAKQHLNKAMQVDSPRYALAEFEQAQQALDIATRSTNKSEQERYSNQAIRLATQAYNKAKPLYYKNLQVKLDAFKNELGSQDNWLIYAADDYNETLALITTINEKIKTDSNDNLAPLMAQLSVLMARTKENAEVNQNTLLTLRNEAQNSLENLAMLIKEEDKNAIIKLIKQGDGQWQLGAITLAVQSYRQASQLAGTLQQDALANVATDEERRLSQQVASLISSSSSLWVVTGDNRLLAVPHWDIGQDAPVVATNQTELFSLYLRAINDWQSASASTKREEIAYLLGEAKSAIINFRSGTVEQMYKVAAGDTLWRIAERPSIYNNRFLWTLIWQRNRLNIVNPDAIFPTQLLQIAPLAP